MKDLTEAARDLTRAPKDLPSLVAKSNKLALSSTYGKLATARTTKQQQLAKLIIELGIDASQTVFAQVRARLERIK